MLRSPGFVITIVVLLTVAVVAATGLPRFGQATAVATATVATGPTATRPPNTPSLSLVGPTSAIAPGARFDVQVVFSSPVASRGTQFGLTYDPRLVQVTGVDEGDYYHTWAQSNGVMTTLVPAMNANASNGWLTPVGIVILGSTPTAGPTGSGVLAVVHLQAASGVSGTAVLTFQDVLVSVPFENAVAALPSVQVTDGALAVGTSAPSQSVQRSGPRLLEAYAPAPWTQRLANWPTPRRTMVAVGVPGGVPVPVSPVPTIPTTLNLAPNLERRDAMEVIVQFADGHQERWLADPKNGLADVRARLPLGATIRMSGPPTSLMGIQPAPPPTRTASAIPITHDLVPNLPPNLKYVIVIIFPDGHVERWLFDDRPFSDLQAYLPTGARIVSGYGPYSTMADGQAGSTPIATEPAVATPPVSVEVTITPTGGNQ